MKYEIIGVDKNNISFVDTLYLFFPLESMSNLIIEPWSRLSFVKTLTSQMGVESSKDYSVHFSSVLIVTVWTAIFIYFSYKILKKRDL